MRSTKGFYKRLSNLREEQEVQWSFKRTDDIPETPVTLMLSTPPGGEYRELSWFVLRLTLPDVVKLQADLRDYLLSLKTIPLSAVSPVSTETFPGWRQTLRSYLDSISTDRPVWKTLDAQSYSEAAARGVRQQAAIQAVLRNAIDAPTTELNIVMRAGSVNAAIQRGKHYYAKSKADGEWKRIDKYRLTRHNNGHRTPEGRSLATGKWFIIDGSNVEQRP